MRYNKADTDNILDIHKQFGTRRINKLNLMSPLKVKKIINRYGIKSHPLLNLVHYNKDEAKKTIMEKMGWRDYGGKHYESIFTRFYQGYVLYAKFKIDKRKAHLASLINSGQITKQEALLELQNPPYPSDSMLREDFEYVAKKFDMDIVAFTSLLSKPPVPHAHFKQYSSKWIRFINKWEVYSKPSLYINYLKKKLKKA
jgi:hypothetical protein